jgi:hypothetical protein
LRMKPMPIREQLELIHEAQLNADELRRQRGRRRHELVCSIGYWVAGLASVALLLAFLHITLGPWLERLVR